MTTYPGFCPISRAVEVLGERWTILIIREMLNGHCRFTDLHFGLPGISRSLLVQRLRMLEDAGVIERREKGKQVEYHLTEAGLALEEIVINLGLWGQRWVNPTIGPKDVNAQMLMWDMHRRIHIDRLPNQRVVAQFDFYGTTSGSYWLLLERPEPSVCMQDLGFDVDLLVTTDALALHRVWMGELSWREAIRNGSIRIEGMPELVKEFPSWLALNYYASSAPVQLTPA